MLCNGDKTYFFGFIYALHIIFLYCHNSFICRNTYALRDICYLRNDVQTLSNPWLSQVMVSSMALYNEGHATEDPRLSEHSTLG